MSMWKQNGLLQWARESIEPPLYRSYKNIDKNYIYVANPYLQVSAVHSSGSKTVEEAEVS